jgi:hypothetical protein
MQLFGILFFALTIPISARARRARPAADADLGDDRRRSRVFGLVMAPLFAPARLGALLTMAIGLSLMGLTYGPLGTGAVGAVPDRRPLHRQLADVQPRRHLRRVARAVHRDVAREDYGLQYVGYYLVLHTAADVHAIAR